MEPTRFENGVTNVLTGLWANAPFLDPRLYHVFFDDFDRYAAGDWTITTTEDGNGSASEALANEAGGVLLITNDDADDDADFFQKVGESFKFAAGKKTFFEARFKVSDATQSDVVMGLQITDSSPLAVSDGVYFIKADGSTSVSLVTLKDSAGTTQAGVATLANATYIRLGFYYDGGSTISVYADDVKVADVAVTAGATLCTDEELTISFGIQNGEAAAKTMSIDYIICAQER